MRLDYYIDIIMMYRYLYSLVMFMLAFACDVDARAAKVSTSINATPSDSLFVYLDNGHLDVYPYTVVSDYAADDNQVVIKTIDNAVHVYDVIKIESVTLTAPANKPYFTSFKFNCKYHKHLFQDVQCPLKEGGSITVTVPAIGKWLAASFQLSDEQAKVYVGRELQNSNTSRHSFALPVEYVVTREGWQVMTLSDESSDGMMDFQPYGTRYTVNIDWPTDNASNVPAIYITTETGSLPNSKQTYIKGTIAIDGGGVYPDMDETQVSIKGRGNTSWTTHDGTWDYKNPYRLKFDSIVKPFGMAKGKNWVLLANNIKGSMMSNAIGMKVAQLAGTEGANHIVPVDLYINNDYRGSYNFTEKIGFHNNSIDLEDESDAALLELDTYTDETIYHAEYYNVPVKIHEPEFDDPKTDTKLTPDSIMADFNRMLEMIHQGRDISGCIDLDAFAAYYLANEYILNMELLHPKSTYLYKEHVGNPDCSWKFGPVWDLDWAFGHELDLGYFTTGATSDYVNAKEMECNNLWRALRKAGGAQDRAYYLTWTRFLRQKSVEELVDFCQEYYDYVKPSFERNHKKWGDGNDYSKQIAKQQLWLKKRAEYVYNGLTAYDISEELPEVQAWEPYIGHESATGIQSLELPDSQQGVVVAIYDFSGRKLQTMQKGINVIHYSNGKAKLVYKK